MMDSYKNYRGKIKALIEIHDIAYKDYSFFMLPRLLVFAEKLEGFSGECDDCKQFMKTLEDQVKILPHIVSDNVAYRKSYEKSLDEISKHLRKKHKLVPSSLFVSLYSFLGIIFGTIAGIAISIVFKDNLINNIIFASIGIGVIIGYVWGVIKDYTYKKRKMVL